MPAPFKNRHYRIGDFAKYLGVTPDFLKHYEDNGLVHASRQNGGYRFFVFQQSARILEFMRLRNCGVHIKDIRSMLSAASEKESIAMLDQRFEEVRKNIEFETAILAEHEQFKKWHAKRLEKPVDWEIGEVEPHYFLPHTNHQDFIDDDRIYELLKAWSAWMPIVKSGMLLEPSADSGRPSTGSASSCARETPNAISFPSTAS